MRRASIRCVTGLMVLIAPLAAAQEYQQLQVTVTSATGRSVFIDHGRSGGIVPGMHVRFTSPGAPVVEGVVQNVASDSARVELAPDLPLPEVGSKGEIEVVIEEDEAPSQEPSRDPDQPTLTIPEHPPWTRDEEARDADLPLLAPAFGQQAKDRPISVDGRVFTQFYYNRDRGDDRESDYYLGVVGVTGEARNLFKQGGRLRFAGETDIRVSDLADEGSDSDTRLRLDRFSYAFGGHEYSPYRVEAGRFYSTYVPELGLMDGVESALHFDNGMRAGIGMGAIPLPSRDRQTGDDLGFHVFTDFQSKQDHQLSAMVAYQKTWHHGDADRDLIVGRLNVRPVDTLWLSGHIKADVYSAGDEIKGSGVGLTEAWFQARYTPNPKYGAALSLSHFSWPELDREEYQDLTPELIEDGRVDRIDLSSWYRVLKNVRLAARINYWNDDEDDGMGGDLNVNWSDIGGKGTSLYSGVYFTQGSYSEGLGGRIQARQRFKNVNGFVGYEIYQYEYTGLISGDEDSTRHTARAGIDFGIKTWYFSVNTDYYFGDEQDAISLGSFVEYRF